MRFPKLSDLDEDQTSIYQGAPVVGTILVTGPPGTGKTVIAFHRAHVLKQRKQQPKVMMFNQVLSRFAASREDVAADVDVSTLHSWASSWWRGITGQYPPPQQAPYVNDWEKIQTGALQAIISKEKKEKISWGHIIIDEGQDFPAVMYACMRTVMAVANEQGVSPTMALTVLADENQRLKANTNATLEEIRVSLGLHESDENVFMLRKNYRNSYEVAKFATYFYVGLRTGMPELPEDRKGGVLPVISLSNLETEGQNLNAFVEKIARYARAHVGEEIGVFVPTNKTRKTVVNRLEARFTKNEIVVQSYSSKKEDDCSSESLVFDEPGHITVLIFESVKGLEFDAVFVIDPGGIFNGGTTELYAKMSLYVMSSRARSFLNLMLVEGESCKKILGWLLPATGHYELERLK